MINQNRHFKRLFVSPWFRPDGTRTIYGWIDGRSRPAGKLMPENINHIPEQPKALAVKLLERRATL